MLGQDKMVMIKLGLYFHPHSLDTAHISACRARMTYMPGEVRHLLQDPLQRARRPEQSINTQGERRHHDRASMI